MSGLTYEDVAAALRKVAEKPFEPSGPFHFTWGSWTEFNRRFGEPTGFRYVRPDGVLVDPLVRSTAVNTHQD